MKYLQFASQYFSHYSRGHDAYPLQLPANGAFMRKHMLCVVGNHYKRALTVGAEGDVYFRLIDKNWQFATEWANRIRGQREVLRLSVRQSGRRQEDARWALGLHPDQLQQCQDQRKTALATLFGPVSDQEAEGWLFPMDLANEVAFYGKDPARPVDFLEEICADAAIDFFRACSYYRGEDLAHPSLLVRAFIREWAATSRHSYDDMLDFFNLHERPPHMMPAIGRARTEESMLATARTWKALTRLDRCGKETPKRVPNVFRVDELLGLVDRFDYQLHTDAKSAAPDGLRYRGRGYFARTYEGASGGWEAIEASGQRYLSLHKSLLRSMRTRGVDELRSLRVLLPVEGQKLPAGTQPYVFRPYARDEMPNWRLQLSAEARRVPNLFQRAPKFELAG